MPYRDVPPSKSFSWPEDVRCAVSLTFDDAKPSQVDRGLPLLDGFGTKATFYVLPDAVQEDLSVWRQAVANGHEMGNHTMSHPCSGNHIFMRDNALEEYSLEQIAQELDGAQQALHNLFGVTPKTFAYTCGHTAVGRGNTKQSYIPLVAERFLVGRGWLEVRHNCPEYCDLSHVFGVPIDRLAFPEVKRLIDDSIDQGGWLILASHHIGPLPEWQVTLEDTLTQVCEYAAEPQRGIWLDTVLSVGNYVQAQRRCRVGILPAIASTDTSNLQTHPGSAPPASGNASFPYIHVSTP